MNLQLLLVSLLGLVLAMMAAAVEPRTRSSGFDATGQFTVEVETPAGARNAVLEISGDLSAASIWRPMIAKSIDGRAARVLFRLPPQPGTKLFARVKTSDSTTLPPVELSGDDLAFISYGDRIEEKDRATFFAAASDKIRESKSLPVAQWQSTLIVWALQDPKVASAKASTLTDDVLVQFKDGIEVTLMRPARRFTGASGLEAPLSAKIQRPAHMAKTAAIAPKMTEVEESGENLPGSNAAVTAFSLESTFPNSAPTIAGWLASNQYQVTQFPSTTVDQVKQWCAAKELGALFWQSHGCPYTLAPNKEGIGLVTRQFAPDYLIEGKYKTLVKAGELKFSIDDNPWKLPYFTIPAKFVRKYFKFAPNSIVVVDACFGASPELAESFKDAGCGSYASWDWLSGPWSGTPCLKIFDRLLGMNQEPPISDPIERSFSLKMTRWWMSAFDFDVDPSPMYENQSRPNAKLTWTHHPDTPAHILKPTIMRVLHEDALPGEPYAKYLIEGDFGDDPGEGLREVLWGGLPMKVVRWSPYNGITIRIPSSPPVGSIQVVMKKNFITRSNSVPITEWAVPFTYEAKGDGGLLATLKMTAKFRADIHGSRGNPEMPPQYLGRLFSNMADCYGTVSGTGTHSPSPGTTITWSGGSNLTSVDHNVDNTYAPRRIRCSGTILYNDGLVNPLHLFADGDFTETEVRTNSDGSTTTHTRQNTLAFPGFYPQPQLPINWGNGAFRGNTMSWPGTGLKLSWPTTVPQAMPDADVPR